MDHLDFSGGVFNAPVVGKFADTPKKYYVISVEYDFSDPKPVGVATSLVSANRFVMDYDVPDSVLEFEGSSAEGCLYLHYGLRYSIFKTLVIFIEIVNAV